VRARSRTSAAGLLLARVDTLGRQAARRIAFARAPVRVSAAEREYVREALDAVRTFVGWVWSATVTFAKENPLVTAAAIATLVRACGATVSTGQTGLLFTFGRRSRRLEPGFHPLVPFVQVARIVPTRSRTLELPDQSIVTSDGLVFRCRANLVWRIVDIEKALIEVDDLERAMHDMLVVAVQRALCGLERDQLRRSPELDERLHALMEPILAPWGVAVERAGFQSIAPSPRSLRVTQLRERVHARCAGHESLLMLGVEEIAALGLVGTRELPRRRAVRARLREHDARSTRRRSAVRRRVLARGPAETKEDA
jgi:hypothetical protein